MTFQKKNVIIVFKASNSGLLPLTSFYRTGVKEMATQRGRKTASGRKRTNNRKRNTRRKQDSFSTEVKDEVILLLGIAVTILLFLSNFHLIGKAGDAVSAVMFGVFGILAYITPPVLFLGILFLILNLGNRVATIKLLAGTFLFLDLEVVSALIGGIGNAGSTVASYYSYANTHKMSGGVIGSALAGGLTKTIGMVGTVALVLILMMLCLVLLTEKSIVRQLAGAGRHVYDSAREDVKNRIERNEILREQRLQEREIRMQERAEREKRRQEEKSLRMDNKVSGITDATTLKAPEKTKKAEAKPVSVSEESRDVRQLQIEETPAVQDMDEIEKIHIKGIEPVQSMKAEDVAAIEKPEKKPVKQPAYNREHKVQVMESAPDDFDMTQISAALEESADRIAGLTPEPAYVRTKPVAGKAAESGQPIGNQSTQTMQSASQKTAGAAEIPISDQISQPPKKPKPYKKPPLTLLKRSDASSNKNSERQLKETALQLKQTLKTFGVNVTITDISQGPAVTRYELQPEMGVKVSKIVNLSDDIKLNLAATDIRIEAPIPGKAAIGIEVPNKENSMVLLRDLLESDNFKNFKSNLSFAVGKDIAGQTVVTDIAKMPHVLIAGSTGSGKSVCINTLIMSILYKASPEDVKLIMVDPKVVELSVYNGIPHLLLPVVTDPKKAAGALHWGVNEMTERYKKFEDMHVRDLKGYNKKVEEMTENGGAELPQKLPQIVIIVDELADLMMVAPGEVEESICRLAQLARAAGIHLVIATQRPSVDVITGLIKANMPSRIAFAVSSGVDSRTILDMNGAEKLLGKGDMLFYPQGYPKPVRVQGAFVSDKEVADVVDYLKENNDVQSQDEVNQQIEAMGSGSGDAPGKSGGENERDMYFADAGRFIIDKDKASIGMLQRVFKIGFNRAARIMDQLCEYGVVGEEEGTKPRKVLMTEEQFEQLLEEI